MFAAARFADLPELRELRSIFMDRYGKSVECYNNKEEVRLPAAGSKGNPKNPRELKYDTSASREEKQILMRAISNSPLRECNAWWSLSDTKYAGTALFVKKCFNPKDCGQPGFTLSERKRFGGILKQGNLLDAYRLLHKDKDMECGRFSWSGNPVGKGNLLDAYRILHKDKDMECGFSWSGNPVGKHRGKRMRIDYFIVSEKLKDRIVACEMHGQGIELQGFYGSDHCPVSLELFDTDIVSDQCQTFDTPENIPIPNI